MEKMTFAWSEAEVYSLDTSLQSIWSTVDPVRITLKIL